jgi:hypothetical protein
MRRVLLALLCLVSLAFAAVGDNPADKSAVIGFDYKSDSKMKTVRVVKALPGGQSKFELFVGGKTFPLEAGKPFFFTTEFPEGVDKFTIRGINESEKLDPTNPLAFPTGISWMDQKSHEITVTPIVKKQSPAPNK